MSACHRSTGDYRWVRSALRPGVDQIADTGWLLGVSRQRAAQVVELDRGELVGARRWRVRPDWLYLKSTTPEDDVDRMFVEVDQTTIYATDRPSSASSARLGSAGPRLLRGKSVSPERQSAVAGASVELKGVGYAECPDDTNGCSLAIDTVEASVDLTHRRRDTGDPARFLPGDRRSVRSSVQGASARTRQVRDSCRE